MASASEINEDVVPTGFGLKGSALANDSGSMVQSVGVGLGGFCFDMLREHVQI